MSVEYVGSVVKIKLNDGSYIEGRVREITPAFVSLAEIPGREDEEQLELYSHEIIDLDIITLPHKTSGNDKKPITIMRRDQSPNRSNSQSPEHEEKLDRNHRTQYKKGDAFTIPSSKLSTEFDFESSNKLFKKEAIFDEWRQQDGILPKQTHSDKLKPTEMVIESSAVPLGFGFKGDFVTDDGVPVVGLQLSKRVSLFKRAISYGLSYSHVVSVAGMAVAQMTVQVLGGSCRINLKNHNKPPVVAVLVSSGDGGKVGLTTALHLSQHGVTVKVVVLAPPKGCEGLVNILNKTKCVVGSGLQGLPKVIDIIIDGTQDRNTLTHWPPWLTAVVDYTESSAAPILTIDPQHPSQLPRTPSAPKWSCALGAPLLSQGKSGRLFLVDIGLFGAVFKDEDVPYTPPFFEKFVIPLNRTIR